MKKVLSKHIPHSKITQQILLVFLICTIVPIVLLSLFFVNSAGVRMRQQYESLVQSDSSRVRSILFDITLSTYTSADTILGGGECMRLFAAKSMEDTEQQYYDHVSSAMSSLYNYNAAISDVHIYTDNPIVPSGEYISCLSDGYDGEEWYEKLVGQPWSTWICLSSQSGDHHDPSQLSLVRRIPIASSEYTAYLVLRLDSNYLKNRIGQTNHLVLISLDSSPVCYSSDSSLLLSDMPSPPTGSETNYCGPANVKEESVLTNFSGMTPYETDNQFVIAVSNLTAYDNIQTLYTIYILIILIATLTPLIIMLLFSHRLSARITTLKTAMHQARLGDYNIIDTFRGNDELQETFQDLKATVEMIHKRESEYYESQLARQQLINKQQQMEFKMLASQINPHFLYNTLETIRMQALANHNKQVATSIKLLGKSMHYVLENTGTTFTTLEKELDYIKTYLSIQQLRFGDRVNFTFSIDETVHPESCTMLPLLLQPIVENAILHGLEDSDHHGQICISATSTEQFLILSVSDNGCGIAPDTLAQLNAQMHQPNASNPSSIGLYNIQQRIRMCYGDHATLHIDSVQGHGATVTMTLPHTPAVL